MIIKQEFLIDGLHYVLTFQHYYFKFSLLNPPRQKLVALSKAERDYFKLFQDTPFYEDLQIRAPALKVFNKVMSLIHQIVVKHQISYWEFSATSLKKANIYEKLLQRYLKQRGQHFQYTRSDLEFYVYPVL